MKRRLLCLLIAFVATVGAMAQIPANVKEVLKKCDEKMDNPAGLVVDPEMPKKMTVKIAKDSYYLREFTAVMGMGKVTMTVTKVTVGAKDSMFKLDMNRYKNAVVVRR